MDHFDWEEGQLPQGGVHLSLRDGRHWAMIEVTEQAVLGFSHYNFTGAEPTSPVTPTASSTVSHRGTGSTTGSSRSARSTGSVPDRSRGTLQSQAPTTEMSVAWQQPQMTDSGVNWGNSQS